MQRRYKYNTSTTVDGEITKDGFEMHAVGNIIHINNPAQRFGPRLMWIQYGHSREHLHKWWASLFQRVYGDGGCNEQSFSQTGSPSVKNADLRRPEYSTSTRCSLAFRSTVMFQL